MLITDQPGSELRSDDVIDEQKSDIVELLPETELDQEIELIQATVLNDNETEERGNDEEEDVDKIKLIEEKDSFIDEIERTEKNVVESSLEISQNQSQPSDDIDENRADQNDKNEAKICQELKISSGERI